MSKKPVAVTLRKPQAPADADSFVGGRGAGAPVRATPAHPIDAAAEVQHGARAYRELTVYLPTDVARELSLYCMDRNCDVSRVVAEAVSKQVTCNATGAPASVPGNGTLGGSLEFVIEHLRVRLSTLWALRR
jgi:hypothetical protein